MSATTDEIGAAGRILKRDPIRDRLIVALAAGPGNILLAGPWGSGKTTLLGDIERRLSLQCPDRYQVLKFSPWSQVADEDPRDGFIKVLATEVRKLGDEHPEGVDKLSVDLRYVWNAVLDFAATDEAKEALQSLPGGRTAWGLWRLARCLMDRSQAQGKDGAQAQAAATLVTARLREQMGKLLAALATVSGKQGCLLLVDDLDRTRPEYAIGVLDALYHLFMPHREAGDEGAGAGWPLSSVWAVNIAMLEEFLYAHYRLQPSFDATAYLEKLFHRRINVPPLFQSRETSEVQDLWRASLEQFDLARGQTAVTFGPGLIETLAKGLNYAVLGNLRLYGTVRTRCCEYWQGRVGDPQATPESFGPQQILRQARLFTLIHAYPGFRESIALYSGMWPHFVNRVNERLQRVSFESVSNPVYRHIDDPNLMTLLMDLRVLQYDTKTGRYTSAPEWERRTSEELGELLRRGF